MKQQPTPLHQQLIDVVGQGRTAERDAAASLPFAERDLSGTKERWSLKDEILHINTLKAVLSDSLAAGYEGHEPPAQGEFQARNDATFAQSQSMTWDEVARYADHTADTLVAEILKHDESLLQQPHLYAWMDDRRTIVTEVVGQCMAHPFQHLSRYLIRRGEFTKALSLHALVFAAYQSLAPSPYWLGKAHYNRAGAYAMIREPDQAIFRLIAAFDSRPDLMEQAREDPDFDTLRHLTAFRELLQ